jgi:GNAT acetyltransferase-like protein
VRRLRSTVTTGYASAEYAASLAEFGAPRHLPRCDGWILERPIGENAHRDAMGPYPMFFCRDWTALGNDLADLAERLVSVVLVPEPFAAAGVDTLRGAFEHVVHFKDHYVADLEQTLDSFVSKSHRTRARRALRTLDVAVCEQPSNRLDDWMRLFANLTQRHSITGLRAFSREAFEAQLKVPGLVMFEATKDGDVVGLDLWYVQGDVAYGHLAAFSDAGYELGASYATKWTMLQHFVGAVRWVDLAGTAGAHATDDGLAAFKAGWSTGTKPVYLCGRVLQPAIYAELSRERGAGDTTYFPAYRRGELV